MSNADECEKDLQVVLDKVNATLDAHIANTISPPLTDQQVNDLQKRSAELDQKLREISDAKRTEMGRQRDAQLAPIVVQAEKLKNDVIATEKVSKIINIASQAISLAIKILRIIAPAPVVNPLHGFAPLSHGFTRMSHGFMPFATLPRPNITADDNIEIDMLSAERDFLRCMVSYLLSNPIAPNAWMQCCSSVELNDAETDEPSADDS